MRRRVGAWVDNGHAVAAVARDFAVGWATVMAAVHEHGGRLLEKGAAGCGG